MFVSVIIPIYNTPFIDVFDCITSLESQIYTNFEILIVDDGSTEECAMYLDRIATQYSNIQVFHKENAGVSSARNYGVLRASGEAILFVDGDDLVTPWLLSDGVKVLKETNADIVIGKINQNYTRSNIEKPKYTVGRQELLDSNELLLAFSSHVLSKHERNWGENQDGWMFNGEGCWAHLIKKDVAIKVPFLSGITVAEDTIWALQCLDKNKNFKICLLHEPWYYYIQNEYGVINRADSFFDMKLIRPVSILNKIILDNDELLPAYLRWIVAKLNQIVRFKYLNAGYSLCSVEAFTEFKRIVSAPPWSEALTYSWRTKGKLRVKLFMCRSGLFLPYLWLKVRLDGVKRWIKKV